MARINPHHSWLAIEKRAAAEKNPRHRKLLTEVRNHMEYEITGQLDALMGTLTATPIYHFWGSEPAVIDGYDAVRGFYQDMMSRGGQQFEVVVERIIVDDDAVITEGQVKIVHKGETLLAMGRRDLDGEPLTPSDLVLTTAQLVTVWPADADGKLIGEDIYFGHDPFLRAERISKADLPDYFQL
ncbi:MAG: nuclear transport factor 2 family protein [Gammaproteobacteria bacterium]|nr:nuclear transport factor 2 family protein [Gammaproteobacteria bacterium]